MKGRIINKSLLLCFCLTLLSCLSLHGQDLTGIWKGYFISDGGDQYKLEFQISQKPTNTVAGVSYSYLDIRFYGKATMTGTFIKNSSSFRIREIRTVEVKSSLGGGTCIMNYNFTYEKSGKEEFLEGTYLGKYEPKYKPTTASKWGECGGGKVFLRKVTTSDFYVEPFLRNKVKNNSTVIYNKPPEKKITPVPQTKSTPVTGSPVTKNNPPAKKVVTPTVKKQVVKPPPITKRKDEPRPIRTDTVEQKKLVNTKTDLPIQPAITPDVLKSRSNELIKTLVVNDSDVVVKLFDNGIIDGDTISVFMDNKLVLASKGLSSNPLIVKLKMSEDNSEHELVMVAENLGRIPPNTSLMVVESGDKRFEVRITSTEQKNALVRFKYERRK